MIKPRARRRHPATCRHCAMVAEYRWARDAAIRAREVMCGDEDLHVPTFKWWLCNVWKGSGVKAEESYYLASAA